MRQINDTCEGMITFSTGLAFMASFPAIFLETRQHPVEISVAA